MITWEQMRNMKENTPVAYGGYKNVLFKSVVTHRDDGTTYVQPHILLVDHSGGEKLIFQSLFMKHAKVIAHDQV
jgi:hypothetical protein